MPNIINFLKNKWILFATVFLALAILTIIIVVLFLSNGEKQPKPTSNQPPWTKDSSSSEKPSPTSPSQTTTTKKNSETNSEADDGFLSTKNLNAPKNAFPKKGQVNVPDDIAFKSTKQYQSPYKEVAMNAVFTGPNGQKMTLPAFWDGDNVWKIRFAPPCEGVWTYVTNCTNKDDVGLHNKSGSYTVKAYTGDAEIIKNGRLRVNNVKDGLTYQNGTPFFWLADTHWVAYSYKEKLNFSNKDGYPSMFKGIVDQRAETGYTAYQMSLNVSNLYKEGFNEGGPQWLNSEIWNKLNPDYWKNIDQRISYIVSRGIVPVIGLDWGGWLKDSNLKEYERITRYVIARYSAYPVVWNIVGEYNQSLIVYKYNDTEIYNYGRLGQYFKDTDPYKNISSVHALCYKRYTVDYFRGQGWYDFVMNEGGHPTHFGYAPESDYYVYSEWNKYQNDPYKLPWLEAEAKYEDIWEIPTNQTREVAYLAIMHGSFGYSYGAEGLYQATWNSQDTDQTYGRLPTPWYKALNKVVGNVQMPYMKNFFTSLPWWKFKPDKTIVNFNFESQPVDMLQPIAKATDDKKWVLIYYPKNNIADNNVLYPDFTPVANGLVPNSKYSAYWFNTISGKYYTISKSLRTNKNGILKLPIPNDLLNNEYMFILRKNDAKSLQEEIYLSAISQNTAMPYRTGEKELPKMEMLPENCVSYSLGEVVDTQGKNNLYYYSYSPKTDQYFLMQRSDIAKTFSWGTYAWGYNANTFDLGTQGWLTNNLFCTGPEHYTCILWKAPADGTIVFDSRPKWKDNWQGGDGAIFIIMQNDETLARFAFDAKNYCTDYFGETMTVKKGDEIKFMTTYNKTYNSQQNQIDINTNFFFKENK